MDRRQAAPDRDAAASGGAGRRPPVGVTLVKKAVADWKAKARGDDSADVPRGRSCNRTSRSSIGDALRENAAT